MTDTIAPLSAFQRDILLTIQEIENGSTDEETAYGLAIKRQLEEWYGTKVNHGRLYPNLDELTDEELVSVDALDKRTNRYNLTARGEMVAQDYMERLQEAFDQSGSQATKKPADD